MDRIQKLATGVWQFVSSTDKKYSAKRLGVLAIAIVGIIVVSGYYSAQTLKWWYGQPPLDVKGLPLTASIAIIAASLVTFLAMLGAQVHGRVGGALIDDRNLMSLSRFQIVAWTVVVVSSLLAMGLARAFTNGISDALNITVPEALWQLLGITSASAVGRELIVASKKTKTVPNADVAATDTADALNAQGMTTNVQEVERHRRGAAYGNPTADDASIVDMFQGDEIGNTAHIDISKVQMFFFTIAAIVAYASNVVQLLADARSASALTGLPEVAPGLLAILSISHATYLGNKSLDHTSGAPSGTAQNAAAAAAQQPTDGPGEQDH